MRNHGHGSTKWLQLEPAYYWLAYHFKLLCNLIVIRDDITTINFIHFITRIYCIM